MQAMYESLYDIKTNQTLKYGFNYIWILAQFQQSLLSISIFLHSQSLLPPRAGNTHAVGPWGALSLQQITADRGGS